MASSLGLGVPWLLGVQLPEQPITKQPMTNDLVLGGAKKTEANHKFRPCDPPGIRMIHGEVETQAPGSGETGPVSIYARGKLNRDPDAFYTTLQLVNGGSQYFGGKSNMFQQVAKGIF